MKPRFHVAYFAARTRRVFGEPWSSMHAPCWLAEVASTRFTVEPSELPGFHQNGKPFLHFRDCELFVAKGNDRVNAGSAPRGTQTRQERD